MTLIEDYPSQTMAQVGRRQEALHRRLLRRAAFLGPQDRAIMQHALTGALSHRQLAKLLNIPAGTLSRRLRRLANRLYNPLVVALVERPGRLRREYRQLGLEFFLQGLTTTQLADRHRISVGQVKRMLQYLRGWQRGQDERS